MRTSTKILAMLLTLALLLGALAIAVVATEEDIDSVTPNLNVPENDKIMRVGGYDFESSNNFEYHYSKTVTIAGMVTGESIGSPNTHNKNHAHITAREYQGNRYAAFWYDKSEENAVNDANTQLDTFWDITTPGVTSDNKSVANALTANGVKDGKALVANDYIVLNWDFNSDMYLDEAGNLTSDPEKGVTLAYNTNLNWALAIRGFTNASTYSYASNQIKIGYDAASKTFNVFNSRDNSKKAALSNEIGMWNHITVVIDIDSTIDATIDGFEYKGEKFMDVVNAVTTNERTRDEAIELVANSATNYGLANSVVHTFVNGKYLSTGYLLETKERLTIDLSKNYTEYYNADNVLTATVSPAHLQLAYVRLGDGSKVDVNYSLGMDNIVTHYYGAGYSGDLAEYMSSEDNYKKKNISYCDDVVYNGSYKTPNPNTCIAEVMIGDVTTPYYTLAGAENALVKDATLIVKDGTKFEDFIVTFPFYVQISNYADFKIKNSDQYSLIPTSKENVYAVKAPTSYTNYYVYAEPFENCTFNSIDDGIIYEGAVPGLSDESLYVIPPIAEQNPAKKDGIFTQFDGWYMRYKVTEAHQNDANVSYDNTEGFAGWYYFGPVAPLTSDIIANCGGFIEIFPHFAEIQYAYSIIDATTGLVVPNIDYTKPKNIVSTMEKMPAGNYILTLYTDIEVKRSEGADDIPIPDGSTLYFDLNGHDYVLNVDVYNYKPAVFGVGRGATLYLYSSKEGGRMFNFTNRYDTFTAGGGALINTSGAIDESAPTTVYCGTVKNTALGIDADGSNLFISAAYLISAGNSVNYNKVYTVVDGVIKDENGDGIIGMADKKDGAETYYSKLYVDGGTYTRPNADGPGYVYARAYLDVDIKNALFVGNTLIATDSRYNPRMLGKIDNCVFYSSTGTIVGQFCEGSRLDITNTLLLGTIRANRCTSYGSYSAKEGGGWKVESGSFIFVGIGKGTHQLDAMEANSILGVISLGEGCKTITSTYHVGVDGKPTVRAAEGVTEYDINEVYNEKTFWYYPEYNGVASGEPGASESVGILAPGCLDTPVTVQRTTALGKGYSAKGETLTVKWLAADGSTIAVSNIPKIGDYYYGTVVAPEVEGVNVAGTSMFKLGVDKWVDMEGGDLPNKLSHANSEYSFKAVMGGIVNPDKTALKPVKQYFDMAAKFTGNIYVPHYEASEVTVGNVTYKISASTWTVNGKAVSTPVDFEGDKYCYASSSKSYSSAFDLDNGALPIVLTYTVTKVEEGKDDVVETITINYTSKSLAQYFIKVFESAKTDEEKSLAANCIQYSMLYYQYQKQYFGGSGIKSADTEHYNLLVKFTENNSTAYNNAVTDLYSESFNSKVANSAAKTSAIPEALANYISGITFYNNAGVLTLCVVPVNNVKNGDAMNLNQYMKLKAKSYDGSTVSIDFYVDVWSKVSGKENLYVEYLDPKGNVVKGQNWSAGTGYFNNVNSHLLAAIATGVLSIELTTIDTIVNGESTEYVDTKYTIQYTLSDYIVEKEATGNETDASAAKLVRAFLALGEASIKYVVSK